MRKYTIGRSQDCNIRLSSQYASSVHAELYQLDTGDLVLVDLGSTNGTFINKMRLAPNKEVSIKRNDVVTFANESLNWSAIAPMRTANNAKQIMTIGTHYLNSIQLGSDTVSKFHATIIEKTDGKWYITDYSESGTSVNGSRIGKYQEVRIKAGDVITCGTETIINPAKGCSWWKPVAAVLAAAAIICAVWFTFKSVDGGSSGFWKGRMAPEELYKKYAPTIALLELGYYFEVSAPNRPDMKVVYSYDDDELYVYKPGITKPMHGTATGFFISPNGMIATSLHVANPALFGTDKQISEIIKDLYKKMYGGLAYADIKVESKFAFIHAYANGAYYSQVNRVPCRPIPIQPIQVQQEELSNSSHIDIAFFQTQTSALPQGATYVNLKNIKEGMTIGTTIYSIGFPQSHIMQDMGFLNDYANKPLQATGYQGQITNVGNYSYGYTGASTSGASGSPVFDDKGNLIGVVSRGIKAGYNYCEKAEYINELLKQIK